MVEALGHESQHLTLSDSVLIPLVQVGERTRGTQEPGGLVDVQWRAHSWLWRLDDDVEAAGLVVDDRRAQPFFPAASRYRQICLRRLQDTRGMVVDQQAAFGSVSRDGQNRRSIPACDRSGGDDGAIVPDLYQKTNLSPTCASDLAPNRFSCVGAQPKSPLFGGRQGQRSQVDLEAVQPRESVAVWILGAQVLSFFFLAAGNRTLLRISR